MIKGIIGGFLGIVIGFLVIVLLIYLFIRSIMNKFGFGNKTLTSLYKETKEAEALEKTRHKQVSGMTKMLLPEIQRDFNDFNEKEIYLLVEKSLRAIFLALENKDISYVNDDEFNLIKEKIQDQIIDLQDNNITYKYDDIIFHKHAIKSYKCQKDVATIEISTSLEYYYNKRKDNKDISQDDVKRQTRYTTQLVYIIDNTKTGFDINILGLHCPNCGSPITSLQQTHCNYCKGVTNIQIASLLKCWKIINYKEDY